MSKTASSLGLLDGATVLGPPLDSNAEVTGLTVDSREVKAGNVFVAAKGTNLDGADFIQFAAGLSMHSRRRSPRLRAPVARPRQQIFCARFGNSSASKPPALGQQVSRHRGLIYPAV